MYHRDQVCFSSCLVVASVEPVNDEWMSTWMFSFSSSPLQSHNLSLNYNIPPAQIVHCELDILQDNSMATQEAVSSFIAGSPPGELSEVIKSIKQLTADDDPAILEQPSIKDAFRQYNEDQLICTKLPGSNQHVCPHPRECEPMLTSPGPCQWIQQTIFFWEHILRHYELNLIRIRTQHTKVIQSQILQTWILTWQSHRFDIRITLIAFCRTLPIDGSWVSIHCSRKWWKGCHIDQRNKSKSLKFHFRQMEDETHLRSQLEIFDWIGFSSSTLLWRWECQSRHETTDQRVRCEWQWQRNCEEGCSAGKAISRRSQSSISRPERR